MRLFLFSKTTTLNTLALSFYLSSSLSFSFVSSNRLQRQRKTRYRSSGAIYVGVIAFFNYDNVPFLFFTRSLNLVHLYRNKRKIMGSTNTSASHARTRTMRPRTGLGTRRSMRSRRTRARLRISRRRTRKRTRTRSWLGSGMGRSTRTTMKT